ncbi:hypothetical protein Lal_00011918 [Lupinus albus]|nr:hypothetical protein Lal_00011918 [Lupinus albus]
MNISNKNRESTGTCESLAFLLGSVAEKTEEQSGYELSYECPIEGPFSELLNINKWCWRRVMVVLSREGTTLSNLNVLSHRNSIRYPFG